MEPTDAATQGSTGRFLRRAILLSISLVLLVGIARRQLPRKPATLQIQPGGELVAGMRKVPAGEFRMGSDHSGRWDERPAHSVRLRQFWMDEHEVTNRQFTEFVEQTSYVTTAEQIGKAKVFIPSRKSWQIVAGADWRHPEGPASSLSGREMQPAVQVSWHDAQAFARWAGKRLPTEAEWEYAARGGLYDADYTWGREEVPKGHYQANYWQGWFPDTDRGVDGFSGLAPVGSFAPNQRGLYDMAGNVWEWCSDWYSDTAYEASPSDQPQGPATGVERVLRGGSWLCAENYSPGIQVSARHHAPPMMCSNHIGFRCVRETRPE